jgi:hypothetical protein
MTRVGLVQALEHQHRGRILERRIKLNSSRTAAEI